MIILKIIIFIEKKKRSIVVQDSFFDSASINEDEDSILPSIYFEIFGLKCFC